MIGKISPEKDLNKLLINLGFEKIVKLGKENLKIEFVKKIKDEYSRTKKINQQDIDNLKAVQDEMRKIKIDCYIIVAKTADSYEPEEIELLKSLKNEDRNFIVLSNKELEPYHPYWEIEETEKLPEKYALDMMGMYRNSLFLYLNDKT